MVDPINKIKEHLNLVIVLTLKNLEKYIRTGYGA